MNLAFLFPGQGSQTMGMGKDFYDNSLLAKNLFDEASEVLSIDMKSLLLEPNDMLEKTQFTQPSILLNSIIAYELFKTMLSVDCKYALGHSLGEFTALYSVGAINFSNAIDLVHTRGKFMQEACKDKEATMMAVIGLEDDILEEFCAKQRQDGKEVWVANYNTQGQTVLAGIKKNLIFIENFLKELGAKKTIILNMSVASHCPLLQPILEPFYEVLELNLKDTFNGKIISNVTAKSYETKNNALKLLKKQLICPVKYKQSIQAIDDEIDCYVEFGSSVLRGLNKRISKKPTFSITNMKSLEENIEKIIQEKI